MGSACSWRKNSVFASRDLSVREVYVGDVFGHATEFGFGEIRQNYDGQLIVHVARDCGFESLPCAVVAYDVVSVTVFDEPAEAVAVLVGLTVFQLRGGPHLVEA